MLEHLITVWQNHFSTTPQVIVRAPGRVNIIGEHTDYNEGWVMPGAMSLSVYILIAKNNTDTHHWVADNFNDQYKGNFTNDGIVPSWANYVNGALKIFDTGGNTFDILIGGDLPVGAGVSSSSSLICGLLFGFQKIFGTDESKEGIALFGSRVEREIIGLQGGIMDQYAIMLSEAEKVMLLDCRTKNYTFLNAELPGSKWLLINSLVKHQLIDSDYNNRADECKSAVAIIQKKYSEVNSLRDATLQMLEEVDLPPVLIKRSRYVIEENMRVHAMAAALQEKNHVKAGELLNQSHIGLRDDYEVSCPELDHLASFASAYEGVYGARMMGGGFGGCLLCLVKNTAMEGFIEGISKSYQATFGIMPDIIDFELADGVTIVDQQTLFS
jgi:galactokinase